MDVEQAIRTRRTHKAYRAEPVPRALLDELLDLARWAPNHLGPPRQDQRVPDRAPPTDYVAYLP